MAEDDEQNEGASGIRSFWSGTITFGLVSVPVTLFPANKPRSFALKMVAPDGATVQRRYVCSKDEELLDWDDIVRGYEIEKGKFVVVEDDELEAIEPRKTREIDLRQFVDVAELDPIYFERAYFLTPAGGANKAYRLLAEVMERTNRAGIATFVMRAKEYVIAILAEKGILRAETLRFHDEIRSPEDVGLPKIPKVNPAVVKKFEQAIAKNSGKVDFRDFLDEYAGQIEKLAEKKRKEGDDIIRVDPKAEEEEGGAEVIDLLEVLSRSLRGQGAKVVTSKRATPKKGAAKRAATRKAPAARKTSSRKSTARKPAARKTASRKVPAKKAATRKH